MVDFFMKRQQKFIFFIRVSEVQKNQNFTFIFDHIIKEILVTHSCNSKKQVTKTNYILNKFSECLLISEIPTAEKLLFSILHSAIELH